MCISPSQHSSVQAEPHFRGSVATISDSAHGEGRALVSPAHTGAPGPERKVQDAGQVFRTHLLTGKVNVGVRGSHRVFLEQGP